MGRHGERLARKQGPLWLRGRSVAAAGCALRDAQARPRPRARKGRRLEGVRPRVWTAYRGLQHGGLLPGRKGDRVLDLPHVQKEHDQELSSGPGDPRVRDKHPGLHGILSYSGYVRSHPALLLTKPLPPMGADDATSRFLASFIRDADAFLFVFRGTKSDDIRNWLVDLSVLELDLDLPYPNSKGAKVHG